MLSAHTESIILSGTESSKLSALHTETIILSVPSAESMILTADVAEW
jgi:hypothetical protein